MKAVEGKTIILGVTGSIAAYRAADLTSSLTQAGAKVFVVMTDAATRLVQPITFRTLSRNAVMTDLWKEDNDWQPGHIELADKADLFVVAPATANTLGLFAMGLAPNLLTNVYLATRAPVLLAPAMNGKMLDHPATVQNMKTLAARGHHFIDPIEGMLACGYEGRGKLAPVARILEVIEDLLGQKKL